MRLFIFCTLSAVALSACGPLSIYHRAGVPVEKARSDTHACETKALRAAPVNNQIRQSPPVFVPPRQSCSGAGPCTTIPGYWLPGHTYTVDVNKETRDRFEASCMAARGYSPVKVPRCPGTVKATGKTKVLPEIGPKSCAIKNEDGSYLIVNRG